MHQVIAISKQRQGDFAKARALYLDYLAISRELDSQFHVNNALGLLGSLAAMQGQRERAARLISASTVFHQISRTRSIPLTEELCFEGMELARQALAESAFATAWSDGKAMSSEEAIAEALALELASASDLPSATTSPTQRYPAGLTDAEVQVLRRLAAGMKTQSIAAELVVAVSTADRHITHIYDTIGDRGRAAATAFALKQGLL